ncbi:MAG: L,D-transpeptidase [Bacteroidales bacterium]
MEYNKYLKAFTSEQTDFRKRIVVKTRNTVHMVFDKSMSFIKKHYIAFSGVLLVLLVPIIIRGLIWFFISSTNNEFKITEAELKSAQEEITKEITWLDNKLESKKPKSYYLIINSSSNEFALFKGNELIKKDKCSTGSYVLLKNGNDQQWMFKTPKGEFRIQGKTTSPVWKKPDWAFVEEGLPVPSANHHSRFEYGVLGDYALNLGHGYLIHGTLYQRFLGLPVTHGCIRLNDANLELVYKSLQLGSKVYIY